MPGVVIKRESALPFCRFLNAPNLISTEDLMVKIHNSQTFPRQGALSACFPGKAHNGFVVLVLFQNLAQIHQFIAFPDLPG